MAIFNADSDLGSVTHLPETRLRIVERMLERQGEVLQNHRGYLQFLEDKSALAELEATWWILGPLDAARHAADTLDTLLDKYPRYADSFHRYYDALQQEKSLEEALDAYLNLLWTEEFPSSFQDHTLFTLLHVDANALLQYLETAEASNVPGTLLPYHTVLREQGALRGRWARALHEVLVHPRFDDAIAPWWQAAAALDEREDQVYSRMMATFRARKHRYRIWHYRNLALASQGDHTRAWILYWHRRIRTTQGLAEQYGRYFAYLQTHSDQTRTRELLWLRHLGAPPVWPPEQPPPRLVLESPVPLPELSTPRSRVERLEVERPQRPARPDIPDRPHKPSVPALRQLDPNILPPRL